MASTLAFDVARTAHDIVRQLKRGMCCGVDALRLGQLHVLSCVDENEGMTMTELADTLHIASPSATAFVDRLTAMKYLSRKHDATNRRVVRLRTTPAGTRMLHRQKKRIVTHALGHLSRTDLRELHRILQRILLHCRKYKNIV